MDQALRALVLLAVSAPCAALSQQYSLVPVLLDRGEFTGDAQWISDDGLVFIPIATVSGETEALIVRPDGTFACLAGPDPYDAQFTDVNNWGVVAGYWGGMIPCFWMQNGQIVPLSFRLSVHDVRWTRPYKLNDKGHVAGVFLKPDFRATDYWYLKPNGSMRFIPAPNNIPTNLEAMNASGLCVGNRADPDNSNRFRGFYWTESEGLQWMPYRPRTSVYDVNEHGLAMGNYMITLLHPRFYLWDKVRGVRSVPGTFGPGTDQGYPHALNDLEHIVGRGYVAQPDNHAMFWSEETSFVDLNEADIQGKQDWIFIQAYDINNKGQIVGYGKYQGRRNSFLLNPKSAVRPADKLEIHAGEVAAGNLGSLASRDGDALRVLRFVTPNQASVAHVELIATLPKDPWYLWLRVTSRVSMSLGQTLRVELFDRARQVWDTQFAYQRDMKESWTYGECIAHRRALDFCDGSRTVRARLVASQPGPTALWSLDLDEAAFEWVETPGR